MQDYLDEKTIALVMKGGKLTVDMLMKAIRKALAEMEKQKKNMQTPQGKQTVKQLARQNVGMSNIEITDKNIKSFERVARKYGVDFALKKDGGSPPKWLVFFKARDADALTAAFKEFSTKSVRKTQKPSLLAQLNKFKEVVKNTVIDRVKNKNRGGHEL